MQSTFRYDIFAGVAGDNFIDTGFLNFEWEGVVGVTRIIQMSVRDANAFIMMSYDGIIWGPEIELDIDDQPIQIPHAARSIQIRNALAGANTTYQLIGYW